MSFFKWWRRRESNPRPKIFRKGVYIHSLNYSFRWFKSHSGTELKQLACSMFAGFDTGLHNRLSCESTPIPGLQEKPERTLAFKQPGRSYNRLRLCLNPPFYEMVGLGMQPELHYPRRSHFAPGKKQTFGSQRIQSCLYDIIEKAFCQDSTFDSALIYPRPLCVKIPFRSGNTSSNC